MKQGDFFNVTYKVTNQVYDGFISTFKDQNPLHTDESFAKENGFDGKVMHGAILNGFLSNFIGEQLPIKNVIVQTYKIAFLKPVYLNDTLLLKVTIADVFESVNCIIFKYIFENAAEVVVAKGEITIGLI
jgi:acyl dehydratase